MMNQKPTMTAEESGRRSLLRLGALLFVCSCYGTITMQMLGSVNNGNDLSAISLITAAQPAISGTENKPSVIPASYSFPQQAGVRDDSSDATVMGMAQGYDLKVHRRFVGSLRKTGFKGSILIAMEPPDQMKPGVEAYLNKMNVTILPMKFVECTTPVFEAHEIKTAKEKHGNTCIDPYPEIKIRWSRYAFLRDALEKCKACTGPVLISDTRDVYFQRDPFGDGAPTVVGLNLYAEHHTIDAEHHFVARRVRICKDGYVMNGPMLCSGTTIAPREQMLSYLNIMYDEMLDWMKYEKCRHKSHGGDQPIMNFLYYSGAFADLDTQIFYPRMGIVNTVGRVGIQLRNQNDAYYKKTGKEDYLTFGMNQKKTWIHTGFDLTDYEGNFVDLDGSPSRVLHQYDRFGPALDKFLRDRDARFFGEE